MTRTPTRRTALRIVGALPLAAGLAAPAIAQARPKLRVAMAPYLPTQSDTEKAWKPMYRYLADSVGHDLDFVVTGDWAAAPVAIAAGHADLMMTGTWGVVQSIVRAETVPIAAAKTHGSDYSTAVIIGRAGIDFSNFPTSAKGKSIAFGDSGGLSAWMWPQYFFRKRHNIDPRSYFQYTEGVGTGAIVISVTEGRIDLGCSWDTLLDQMTSAGTIKKESYQVVVRSEPIPSGGLVVRKGFDPTLGTRIAAVLEAITPERAKQLGMPAPYDGWARTAPGRYDAIIAMGRELNLLT
jgi:phosphate/phosphite/phosphonate ABC transporter binding protein